jgi:DNA-binding transcriptional regulator WhiA
MKKIFNEEQEKFIMDNFLKMTDTEIANRLEGDFTQSQITGWRHNHGLKRDRRLSNIFTEKDIEFLKNNYNKMSYKEIANILGYTEKQIRGKVNNLNLKKLREINEHYFDSIDEPLKAYFLGFIFADGWVVYNKEKRNYELGMQLQSRDKYIIDKLNFVLGNVNLITHHDPYEHIVCGNKCMTGHTDKIRIYSKNLIEGLMKNGVLPNKTQKDVCPKVSDEFFFDFMRGYIDGDGCFWEMKNNYYMHITCASENILSYLQKRLRYFGIDTKIYKEKERKYRLMCVNKNEMGKLIRRIYPDKNVFCLERKRNKVYKYLNGLAI